MDCRICSEPLNHTYHTVREMMFGLKTEFQYLECSSCGCLQITEYPADISSYYPPDYYSFVTVVPELKTTWWQKYKLGLKLMFPRRMKAIEIGNWVVNCKMKPGYNILDIGCGKGRLVCLLYNLGFTRVQGIDKFLPEPIDYGSKVQILKKDLSELPAEHYDALMMHHVFEHIEDQLPVLQECYRILKRKRYLLIRIPVKNYAWEKYNTDWVQIDAPRHFFIHTVESFQKLVSKTPFQVEKIEYDSTGFQFWGSEQYKKDIPLMAPGSYLVNNKTSIFSESEILEFDNRAEALNAGKSGDQAAFYLYKP